MEEKNIDLMERMTKLKEEIRERFVSRELEGIDYSKITKEDMEEINHNVDENIKIDIKLLGNPQEGECYFEVKINDDDTINYEYYNMELEELRKEME